MQRGLADFGERLGSKREPSPEEGTCIRGEETAEDAHWQVCLSINSSQDPPQREWQGKQATTAWNARAVKASCMKEASRDFILSVSNKKVIKSSLSPGALKHLQSTR